MLHLLVVAVLCAAPLAAQRELAGTPQIKQALERLRVLGTILMIAAHPDDENTAVLAYFARGRHMRTAYLALTRGEGGQNLIGPEQGDLMGVIRTQELLAARRIDGAEQFFTRAIDFGYSKTAEETLAKWGREEVLSDVVWVIRKLQPDVILLRFSGTAQDGHGHHQAAGILGREAFRAAADPSRFPEQLAYVEPWQATRLFWNVFGIRGGQFSDEGEMPERIDIDAGEYDPVLGYSYAEIAGMSRSNHRSQGFGAAERKGPARNSMIVVDGNPASTDPFDGIDTRWSRLPGGALVGRILDRAAATFNAEQPADTIPVLLEARPMIERIDHPLARRKLVELDETIALCAGLWLDAAAERASVSPGETVRVNVTALNRSRYPIDLVAVDIPGAGEVTAVETLRYNQPSENRIVWNVPDDEPLSQPEWLREPVQGTLYSVPQEQRGQPDSAPVLTARFTLRAAGVQIEIDRAVVYRWVDRVRGELTRPLAVEPPVSLAFALDALVFPSPGSRPVEVTVTANRDDSAGSLRLELPSGWSVNPASRDFSIASTGEQAVVSFEVTPAAASAAAAVTAVARVGEAEVRHGTRVIEYDHIPPQTLSPPARAALVPAEARTLARTVGYVMGAGDDVPEALRQLGCQVTLLEADDLARGDLSRFDAIVTGARAYNTRPDLVANQQRLLDYVSAGGTLVVQYNVSQGGGRGGGGPDPLARIGPYPIRIGRDRVAVEEAPVRFLAPDHPLMQQPNRITAADFNGWIQERGLYFASSWDERYTPLFESNDPDEAPLAGSTLVAPYGKGAYVFSSLSWFRELPAGVPGAYRIFANFLSAAKTIQ